MSEKASTGRASAPDFSQEAMEQIFFWARDRVASAVAGTPKPDARALGELGERRVLGAFVSVKKRGALRSCMGYMFDGCLFGEALDSAAVSAALHDPRFPALDVSEFYDLDLEVWALGAMREIEERGDARRDAFEIGVDGLQIQCRGRRGLLLPSVPVELGWDKDRFLEGLCDKAGLARGSWRSDEARLFAFRGESYKKPFVWEVSRNPALSQAVAAARESIATQRQRTTFSLSPNLFQWQAPSTSRSEPRDLSSETRPSAVAGMFYPGTGAEQGRALDEFEATAGGEERESVAAALVPHAGWVYSGRLASRTLGRAQGRDTIVVFAPKHRREGANFAVSPHGKWDYRGGVIANDLEFANAFCAALPEFQQDAVAHRSEHSIEVELPILARHFPGAKVVGALIGSSSREELQGFARRFAAFLKDRDARGLSRPLFVISSDMNHYANEETTRALDQMAMDAMETLDPDRLYEVVRKNRISMCGVLPAYFVLSTLRELGELTRATKVGYATSGEASGDYERVVGYAGYLFN